MSAAFVARRLAFCAALGIVLAWGMNEATFRLLRTDSARAPETIQLQIPAGTAERVRNGESVPSIPAGMLFVIGDILLIDNRDSVGHTLGPFFIPARSSTNIQFETPEKYSYECSFSPDDNFGLEVRLPVTSQTRLTGAVFAGLPLGLLIGLYSLVVSPAGRPKAAV